MAKREPSYTVGGNVNWCSHCGKQYGGPLRNLKTESAYDPAIPLWQVSAEKKTVSRAVRQEKGNMLEGNERVTGP